MSPAQRQKRYRQRLRQDAVVARNGGRHYWLTPPELMRKLTKEFAFDFDACPHPRPKGFDGLLSEWGELTYINPPFFYGTPTAWARKAIAEHRKGKTTVMVFPVDKWILRLIEAGAEIRNLGDVRWLAIEDGKPCPSIGRHIAAFILKKPRRRCKEYPVRPSQVNQARAKAQSEPQE